MGCNCKELDGFKKTLAKAIVFEKETGKKAAIFKSGEIISFTDLNNINKVKGICCYFTTDSKEHAVVKTKTTKKKEAEKE